MEIAICLTVHIWGILIFRAIFAACDKSPWDKTADDFFHYMVPEKISESFIQIGDPRVLS